MRRQHQKVERGYRPQIDRNVRLALLVIVATCLLIFDGHVRPGHAEERLEVAGFSFSAPAAWVRQAPASNMRAAQFLVPNPGPGYDGTVVFYRFPPGVGGSAERNIARWYSQFKESKEVLDSTVETRANAGRQLHYFRARGTLIGRDGEMPDHTLHAALLEGPAGRVFVRFVAPNAVAKSNEAPFRKLINSAFGD